MRGAAIHASGYSHTGKIRSINEDNIYMNRKYMKGEQFKYVEKTSKCVNIYAVFDGMGGEMNGELAAAIAVETLEQYQDIFETGKFNEWNNYVKQYINQVNKAICTIMRKEKYNMGSTVAIACISENTAKIYNLGDSRVYFMNNGNLIQLTHDHTVAQQLADIKLITYDEVRTHPKRNKLTRHLGIFEEDFAVEPFISQNIILQENDMLLLCSDGLTDMCSNEEIKEIMKLNEDTWVVSKNLVDKAIKNGGRDNISVIVLKI
jgi:protein phosphatase